MNENKAPQSKEQALRRWFIRAIWCFGSATLAGVLLCGVLLLRIGQIAGWNKRGDQVKIYSKEQIDKFLTSVLIAIQNQPLGQANARADLVFIASFNALEQRLSVVALASGTLVEVEGYGQKSLGETYALGGPGLLVNAINQTFELDLQNYACTDTHALARMIDLLGGIPAELTPDEAGYINDALLSQGVEAGPAILSGLQSMVYAMDELSGPSPLGNLSRSLTLVQSAVLNMRKTATKEAMIPLLSLVFSNIQTNLDFAGLHDVGYEILKAEDIEYRSLSLPAPNTWVSAQNGEALRADIPRNAALLRETLYNAQ